VGLGRALPRWLQPDSVFKADRSHSPENPIHELFEDFWQKIVEFWKMFTSNFF
jgi:hypothetical protein